MKREDVLMVVEEMRRATMHALNFGNGDISAAYLETWIAELERSAAADSGRGEVEKEISQVITGLASSFHAEIIGTPAEEIQNAYYHFRWDHARSVAWNVYMFSDLLELHKEQVRKWEEHHNGSACVVERVRDKYIMPKVHAFLVDLAAATTPPAPPAGVDGWTRAPTKMVVDGEALKAIEMMCGGCEPENEFSDGILWIGEAEGDEGEKTYGLHLSSAEYPEEGCLTLVEFPPPPTGEKKP